MVTFNDDFTEETYFKDLKCGDYFECEKGYFIKIDIDDENGNIYAVNLSDGGAMIFDEYDYITKRPNVIINFK